MVTKILNLFLFLLGIFFLVTAVYMAFCLHLEVNDLSMRLIGAFVFACLGALLIFISLRK